MTNTYDDTIGIHFKVSRERIVSIVDTAIPVAHWLRDFKLAKSLPLAEALMEGCSTAVVVRGGEYDREPKHRLSRARLAAALGELLSQGSYAAAQFVMGREDANHADIILQQAVFGEVVYG